MSITTAYKLNNSPIVLYPNHPNKKPCNKQKGKFYYNAAIYNDTYKDTYVLDPRITAVNGHRVLPTDSCDWRSRAI